MACHDTNPPRKVNQAAAGKDSVKVDSIILDHGQITRFKNPNTITRKIRRDRQGNLLMASYEGIFRNEKADGYETSFTNWTKQKGLDTAYAFDVLESRNGDLWIASDQHGAYRYDLESDRFTHFTVEEGLAHRRLIDIFEDQSGKIWFSTQGGISQYDPASESFSNYTAEDGLPHSEINCILQDQLGKLWIATVQELYIYDPKKETANTNQESQKFIQVVNNDGEPFLNIRTLLEDQRGDIWLGGGPGLWRYRPNRKRDAWTLISNHFVGYIYEDDRGNIWTSSDGRNEKGLPTPHQWVLSRYDAITLNDDKPLRIPIYHDDGMFFGICQDRFGAIWVGTLNGVFRYNEAQSKDSNQQHLGKTVSALNESIWAIYEDQKGHFWFGSNGQGVFRYDGNNSTQFTMDDGLVDNQLRDIQGDQEGNVYFDTPSGVSKFDGRGFTTLTPSNASHGDWQSEPGDLWFKGNGDINGVYRYDGTSLMHLKLPEYDLEKAFGREFGESPFSPYGVYGIYQDRADNLWFGTLAAGVYRYQPNGFGLWISEQELTILEDGRAPGIRSMVQDKEGNFWLSNILYRYRIREEGDKTTYEKLKGIESTDEQKTMKFPYFISSLIDHKNQDLWMVTYSQGVWRYDGEKLLNYVVKDGESDVLLACIYQDREGNLWLGTQSAGVYRFNGASFVAFEI